MQVFVDTGAWLALECTKDAHHSQAKEILSRIKKERLPMMTSDYVIDESITLIRNEAGLAAALLFAETVFNSRIISMVEVDRPIREKAMDILRRYSDKQLSFTDCTSFAIMEQMGVKHAFSFDRHFKQIDWIEVL